MAVEEEGQEEQLDDATLQTLKQRLGLGKDFNLTDYFQVRVNVDMDRVTFPESEWSIRDIDSGHISHLVEMFKPGILPTMGLISVHLKSAEATAKVVMELKGDEYPHQLLDEDLGGIYRNHRNIVFKLKRKRATTEEEGKRWRFVPTYLWLRKDSRPLSRFEVISIGALLNNKASSAL